MAEPKRIEAEDAGPFEHLSVEYVKRRRHLYIAAYSEGMVQLNRPLGAFLRELGISLDDCRKALEAERGE